RELWAPGGRGPGNRDLHVEEEIEAEGDRAGWERAPYADVRGVIGHRADHRPCAGAGVDLVERRRDRINAGGIDGPELQSGPWHSVVDRPSIGVGDVEAGDDGVPGLGKEA